ncbi:MAG: flavin reductase family protein [Bacteroidales bacterium]|jgi:flavin reductase (DIM6/NTAB) family NADH-FMN oxidoreductase RutF|nr:flavin reductase family protein [Bacteroidales bacterium]
MDENTFSKLTYGVYIIASGDKTRHNAFVATAVFQVTAMPQKIAVVCSKNNFTTPLIAEKKAFSISVLKQDYTPTTMGKFGFRSGKDFDKFAGSNYFFTKNTGVPVILDDTITWFECEIEQSTDVGTHILFIGKVIDCEMIDENQTPLTYRYYHAVKKGLIPKNAPSYADVNKSSN